MTEKKSTECIDIHVTELFGVQVLRKYVKTVGKNDQTVTNREASRGLCILWGAVPVMMILSTIICVGVMVALLYNPPPLLKELSESVLVNFGKSNTLALEGQLRNAKDRIGNLEREKGNLETEKRNLERDKGNLEREKWNSEREKGDLEREKGNLEREIGKLKEEGLVNFTREQQVLASLSTAEQEKVGLLKNAARVHELQQNMDICMGEKDGLQKSHSNLEKRENIANQALSSCDADKKQLNGEIKKLRDEESLLRKSLKAADEYADGLEKDFNKSQSDMKAIDKKLETSTKTLTAYQAKNEQCQKRNDLVGLNLSDCQKKNENLEKDKDTLTKDLDAAKYTLGNCKNKNMDHEVRSLELLQEIEGLRNELKAC